MRLARLGEVERRTAVDEAHERMRDEREGQGEKPEHAHPGEHATPKRSPPDNQESDKREKQRPRRRQDERRQRLADDEKIHYLGRSANAAR